MKHETIHEMKIDNNLFEILYELEEIINIKSSKEMNNMVDISVEGSQTFFLSNGILSHNSAANSISKLLGRQGNGFYAMFGVPLNAYAATLKEILKSVKMIDLKDILGIEFSKNTQDNLNFDNIVITTDYDLPGHFIAGQLVGLLYRFGPNLFEEGRVRRLVTPLMIATDKKENIVEWFYSFEEYTAFEKANKSKNYNYDYKKGLGSFDQTEMEIIINKDGLENMTEIYVLDNKGKQIIEDWLGDNTQARKDLLSNVEFDMMFV